MEPLCNQLAGLRGGLTDQYLRSWWGRRGNAASLPQWHKRFHVDTCAKERAPTSAGPFFLSPFSFQSITFLLEVQWRIVLEIELQSFPSVKIQTQITWRVHTWSEMPTHDVVFFPLHEPNVPEADGTHRRAQTPLWLILENLPDFSTFQASPDIINISNRCYEASLWHADVALRSKADPASSGNHEASAPLSRRNNPTYQRQRLLHWEASHDSCEASNCHIMKTFIRSIDWSPTCGTDRGFVVIHQYNCYIADYNNM